MIRFNKCADECRLVGSPTECWCLHGNVGMAADWRSITQQLAQTKIDSRAIDLWRFLENEPISMGDLARELNAEASDSRATQRILVGYSMGGRLALHALTAANPPWQAAVIISAHPGLDAADERQTRLAADQRWAAMAMTAAWPDFLTAWNAQAIFGGISRDVPPSLTTRRCELARSFTAWSLGAQSPLWSQLPSVQIPVLWIAGEHDSKFRDLAQRAASSMPRATLAIAPAAGHRVPTDHPTWLADQIRQFALTGVCNH